jgi:hypothetical protein
MTQSSRVTIVEIPCKECDGHGCDECGDCGLVEAENFRSSASKLRRAQIIEFGDIPVLRKSLDEVESAVSGIRDSLAEQHIRLGDEYQLALTWDETTSTGHTVQCCGMLDNFDEDAGIIYDLKRTRNGHPMACQRDIEAYRYNVQAYAYTRGIEANYPDLVGRVSFVDLFCEVDEPPYTVTAIRPTGTQSELGRRQWQRAIDCWHECHATGIWPAYSSGIIAQEATDWALKRDMEQDIASSIDPMEEWK